MTNVEALKQSIKQQEADKALLAQAKKELNAEKQAEAIKKLQEIPLWKFPIAMLGGLVGLFTVALFLSLILPIVLVMPLAFVVGALVSIQVIWVRFFMKKAA